MEKISLDEVLLENLKIPLKQFLIEVIRNSLIISIYLRYRDKLDEVKSLMDEAAKKLEMARYTSDILIDIFKFHPSLEFYCKTELQNLYNSSKNKIICQFPMLEKDLPENSPYDLDYLLRPAPRKGDCTNAG